MPSYQEALRLAEQKLKQAGIENYSMEAWYLLSAVIKQNRAWIFMNAECSIAPKEQLEYDKLISRRMTHEPMQYIIGEQEFMGFVFQVNENVLIPRQDTEVLVELAMKVCEGKSILDVCTGSGCIAISLAKLTNPCKVTGLDLSEKALEVARVNAKALNTEVDFICSDMFSNVSETYDVIVSNPPYIPTKEIYTLMPEVRDYEPRMALDGTEDGLKFYRILACKAKQYFNGKGSLFLEIGCEQAQEVHDLLLQNGYYNIKVTKDYAGLDRVVSAEYRQ